MKMQLKAKFILPLAFVLLAFLAGLAPDSPVTRVFSVSNAAQAEGKHTAIRMVADVKDVVPGSTFMLGIELTMQPGWHTYYKECGDAGMPTTIDWVLPKGYTHGDLLWQKPHKFDDGGIVTYGYADKTIIAAKITAPDTIPDGPQKFDAKVKWLECKESCIPGQGETSLTLSAGKKGANAQPGDKDAFNGVGFEGKLSDLQSEIHGTAGGATETSSPASGASNQTGGNPAGSILDSKITVADSQGTMPVYMYFALAVVGGFILNFMPCVLPVIAIKIISLMEQVDDDPGRVRVQGLVFSAGILSSFLALAILVLAVRSAGQSALWGFQMQYPPFVIAMATIIMVFSLSLFGLFYVSAPGQGSIDKLANKEGFSGTFFKGVLATVLSTPCTAPALGSAVGFAFTQPPIMIVGIFEAVGFGLSLPYLLLTINPKWLRFIPKPGVWMEKFKEAMGFVLMAVVAWLLSVVGSQVGASGVESVGFFLTGVAFAVWITARFTDLTSTSQRKAVVWSIAGVIFAACLYTFVLSRPDLMGAQVADASPAKTAVSESGINWQPFTIEALDKSIADNKTIMLDFTADWCLTCKVNERTVLDSAPVVEQLKALHVVTMKADWTRRDATISKLLQKFERSGVPLYVVFPAGKGASPIVLPEVITPSLVVDKLKEAGPSKS